MTCMCYLDLLSACTELFSLLDTNRRLMCLSAVYDVRCTLYTVSDKHSVYLLSAVFYGTDIAPRCPHVCYIRVNIRTLDKNTNPDFVVKYITTPALDMYAENLGESYNSVFIHH
ncbi:hypothetical protein GDO81_022172 [Engystomops pustulosus]|uniref:Uncharacterized protein n=1 Tax=Engystomops pustulosus TaxID=76066 RepID=A0AAV6YUR6_ENGPU|nr:hypothetical protein GDO81_022172 [Engystomops pustulosus]